jgi:hypothetical protein
LIAASLITARVMAAAAWAAGASSVSELAVLGAPPALLATSAAADPRAPDARSGGSAPAATPTGDLRSPDTRDAATPIVVSLAGGTLVLACRTRQGSSTH